MQECLITIFLELDIQDILNCSLVCRIYHEASRSNRLWGPMLDKKFTLHHLVNAKNNYKKYKACTQISAFLNKFGFGDYLNNPNVNIMELYLADEGLDQFPLGIYKIASITDLILEDNMIKYISPKIGQMTNLTELCLQGNILKTIPDKLCNLTNLETLILDDNRLVALPDRIGNLINLKYLSMHNNLLEYLPYSIWELLNLTHLDISLNPIRSVHDGIDNLVNLKCLRWCYTYPVPEGINRLLKLEELLIFSREGLDITIKISKRSQNIIEYIRKIFMGTPLIAQYQ